MDGKSQPGHRQTYSRGRMREREYMALVPEQIGGDEWQQHPMRIILVIEPGIDQPLQGRPEEDGEYQSKQERAQKVALHGEYLGFMVHNFRSRPSLINAAVTVQEYSSARAALRWCHVQARIESSNVREPSPRARASSASQ